MHEKTYNFTSLGNICSNKEWTITDSIVEITTQQSVMHSVTRTKLLYKCMLIDLSSQEIIIILKYLSNITKIYTYTVFVKMQSCQCYSILVYSVNQYIMYFSNAHNFCFLTFSRNFLSVNTIELCCKYILILFLLKCSIVGV